jgi:uncharacterized glyoxalase superfamily protein PhnB
VSTRPPRPQGTSWISPYLTVKDVAQAIEFYEKAFGFEKRDAFPGPDGKIVHASLIWQDCVIMLGPEGACESKTLTPATSGTSSPISLYIYTPDVDALFARATKAGAKEISAPQDAFWGDRICQLADPAGYTWCFATNVGDFDPSKAPW